VSIEIKVGASAPGGAGRVIVAQVIRAPSTALLVGVGCVGLAALRARRRPVA